jgi:hypothetical protein
MLAIAQKLDKLADLYSGREILAAEKRSVIAQALAPEALARFDEIEAEFTQKEDGASAAIERLEAEIKSDTLAYGATVKGSVFLAVWNKGREDWDGDGLRDYARAHPEVLDYCQYGEPSVSIRRVQPRNA